MSIQLFLTLLPALCAADELESWPPGVERVTFVSPADDTEQPALFFAPAGTGPFPLLVGLHTWSSDYLQRSSIPYARWCVERRWAFIHPNFRGPNRTPEATGSELAVEDILAAVDFARRSAPIDARRIYLVGTSGGGHAALLMAGRAPHLWAGVSAWVPITDLAAWYRECTARNLRYAGEIATACRGAPLEGTPAFEEARRRSPLTYLHNARGVSIDINAGIRDGHSGSVPISHSLHAFNLLADEKHRIDEATIRKLVETASVPEGTAGPPPVDDHYGDRRPLFRRASGRARVTIFDGGHEIVVGAALAWLAQQRLDRRDSIATGSIDAISIETPLEPPEWALLERELLRANEAACREFFDKYFDVRGFLLCVERWGGDDGPDDAIENLNDWPILHALGADDDVIRMVDKAWEGHLRQYTLAKTTEVPFARDGMYYKEFPVMFDWLHNGEGLTVFNLMGLSLPRDRELRRRVRRYAGFYMNEDPGAPNYDPEHRIIRSLFNGSRGPLLRKATALDWTGDPIEVEGRFELGHGERSYEEMLAHFKDYNDIVGDHPQNLSATTLALNAYMLQHEPRYREWLLEYVDAWLGRIEANGGVIPTNIGLDGTIGGECDGKWYGGVYGWAFSVIVPQTGGIAHRNTHGLGIIGFTNAYLLTGDDRYLDGWRRMIDVINSKAKVIDGQRMYPTMHGDDGWYAFTPSRYTQGAREIWYLSMRDDDLERMGENGWVQFLEGDDDGYPARRLRADLARVRDRVRGMRRDRTTPDTRLSDDPMKYNPASVSSLIELALGGIHPGHRGAPLHCRLRYFDPVRRRAGLPQDVAALVTRLTADAVDVTLVNVSQVEERTLVVQAGGYAEHRFTRVTLDGMITPLDRSDLEIRLAPGAGATLELRMKRHVERPRLGFPWER